MNSKHIVVLLLCCLALASARTINTYPQILNAVVQNYGGINCLINSVNDIEDYVNDFSYEIKNCGVKQSKEVTNILKDCDNLKEAITKVTRLNNNKTCKNTSYDNKDEPTSRCANQFRKAMDELVKVLKATEVSSSKTIKNSCSQIAVSKFHLKLGKFQNMGQTCGKLAVE